MNIATNATSTPPSTERSCSGSAAGACSFTRSSCLIWPSAPARGVMRRAELSCALLLLVEAVGCSPRRPADLTLDGGAWDLATADLNCDGHLDLIAATGAFPPPGGAVWVF